MNVTLQKFQNVESQIHENDNVKRRRMLNKNEIEQSLRSFCACLSTRLKSVRSGTDVLSLSAAATHSTERSLYIEKSFDR